jgi:hypothetical protein
LNFVTKLLMKSNDFKIFAEKKYLNNFLISFKLDICPKILIIVVVNHKQTLFHNPSNPPIDDMK